MPTKPPPSVETYGIYVGFDQIKNEQEREYYLNLPTTFSLPKNSVDDLMKIGPKILAESEEFKKLVDGLK
jgi:NTE family protein